MFELKVLGPLLQFHILNAAPSGWRKGSGTAPSAYTALAVGFDSGAAAAYYTRGLARGRKGDWGGARGDSDRAIDLKPHSADARLSRGLVSYALGEVDAAIGDFTAVCE